jgi:predicted nucleic acid-binding protein
MLLLDTDVCVDIARGYPPALAWFDALPELPGLPGLVAMELMSGCRNRSDLNKVRRLIIRFRIYWPSEAECNQAMTVYGTARLSHSLDLLDALIAQCAIGLNATLCTFNIKHYKAIAHLQTRQPYAKL